MKRADLNELLEECLAQLQDGARLEEVLARHQPWADQLRPLLEIALLAKPLRAQASGLKVAQNRSRARFLGAASQRREAARPRGFKILAGMRMASAVMLAAVVVIASLLGSGLASAAAVPGEVLYPVKRVVEQAQMALTTRQSSRLELEESFDQRRSDEVEKLIHSSRTEKVEFAGFLIEDPQLGWFVDQVRLILTPDQEVLARTLNGSYVEVEGEVRGEDGVVVSELTLRLFHLNGTLDLIQADEWVVSGIQVKIQPSTQVVGTPQVGARVEITVLRLSDGKFLALSAQLKNSSSKQAPSIDGELAPADTEGPDETPEMREIIKATEVESGGGDISSTPEPDDPPALEATPDPDPDGGDSTESPSPQSPSTTKTDEPDSDNSDNTPKPTKTED